MMSMPVDIVELDYRGILQQKVAWTICRAISEANTKMGKACMLFMRWNDSPMRVAIPAKYFVVVGPSLDTMEGTSIYEPEVKDVVVVLDDTLLLGLEPWARSGIRKVTDGIKEGGLVVMVTKRNKDEISAYLPKAEHKYRFALVDAAPISAGLWRPLDPEEVTHVKVLGTIAQFAPEVVDYGDAEAVVKERYPDKLSVLKEAYERKVTGEVTETGPPTPVPKMLGWRELPDVPIAIKAAPISGRNPYYSKGTAKTAIPVIDRSKCSKCALCWMSCPEGAIEETPDGFFNVLGDYCSGCGICASVCPLKCIEMVNKLDLAWR